MSKPIILIDLNQTLVKSNSLRLKSRFVVEWVKSLHHQEVSWLKALVVLVRFAAMISEKMPTTPIFYRARDILGDELNWSSAKSESFLQDETNAIFNRLSEEFSPLQDGIDFVHWAKRENYRVVLATNPVWPLSVVEMRMKCSGLTAQDFEFVTEPKTFCTTKPRVHFYEEVLVKLNAPAQGVWMVGDNPRKDGSAAQLGIQVFIIDRDSPSGTFARLKEKLLEVAS